MTRRTSIALLFLAGTLGLAACERSDDDAVIAGGEANALEKEEPVSIIREEVIEEAGAKLPEARAEQRVIGFPEGGAELDERSMMLLDQLVAAARDDPDAPVTIWGHSDSQGSEAANMAAASKRAESVAAYLVDKGIDEDRIRTISLGDHNPVAPNLRRDGSDDEEAQAQNRRVEVIVGNASDWVEPAEETVGEAPTSKEQKDADASRRDTKD